MKSYEVDKQNDLAATREKYIESLYKTASSTKLRCISFAMKFLNFCETKSMSVFILRIYTIPLMIRRAIMTSVLALAECVLAIK